MQDLIESTFLSHIEILRAQYEARLLKILAFLVEIFIFMSIFNTASFYET